MPEVQSIKSSAAGLPCWRDRIEMAVHAQDKWNVDMERLLREALATIRFGTITLVIQDGLVIQIDKSEKIRLSRQGHINGSGI